MAPGENCWSGRLNSFPRHSFEDDDEFRSADNSLVRDFGDLPIRRLRELYGSTFAPGCRDDATISDVVAKMHALSLWRLVKDYQSGALVAKLAEPPRRRGGPIKPG